MATLAEVYAGARFGYLTVVGRSATDRRRVDVRCDCGTEKNIFTSTLGNPTKSCGCRRSVMIADAQRSHGMTKSPEYNVWVGIKQRCLNPNHKYWKYYGGRGIAICDRWRDSFEAFLEDVGPRPKGMTIDRINNDRGYEPGNVRWTTAAEQGKNKRNSLKTICKNGHIRSPENTRVTPAGGRACRPCAKEAAQRKRDEIKATRQHTQVEASVDAT